MPNKRANAAAAAAPPSIHVLNGRKGGRPKTSTQSSAAVLALDLREGVRLNRRTREIIEGQVAHVARLLNESKDLPLVERLQLVTQLTEILAVLSKTLESTAKFVMAQPKAKPTESDDAAATTGESAPAAFDALLAEMKGYK